MVDYKKMLYTCETQGPVGIFDIMPAEYRKLFANQYRHYNKYSSEYECNASSRDSGKCDPA